MNLRVVGCPDHGLRALDLDGPEPMCEHCRVLDTDGRPLGDDDGRVTAFDVKGDVCGDVRPWQGRLYVCDLPIGHADEVHQQSGGITWRHDGAIV